MAFPVLYPQAATEQPTNENFTFSRLENCSYANKTKAIVISITENGTLCEILITTFVKTLQTSISGAKYALSSAVGFIMDNNAYLIGARLRQVDFVLFFNSLEKG